MVIYLSLYPLAWFLLLKSHLWATPLLEVNLREKRKRVFVPINICRGQSVENLLLLLGLKSVEGTKLSQFKEKRIFTKTN